MHYDHRWSDDYVVMAFAPNVTMPVAINHDATGAGEKGHDAGE